MECKTCFHHNFWITNNSFISLNQKVREKNAFVWTHGFANAKVNYLFVRIHNKKWLHETTYHFLWNENQFRWENAKSAT